MRKLSTGELKRLSPEEFRLREKLPLVLILDNVRSGLNVGAAFRTADAFALEAVFLCGITARPPHREILKTAIGASATVAWEYFEDVLDAVRRCRETGKRVLAVEQTDASVPLSELEMPEAAGWALIFGNEVKGVSAKVLDKVDGAIEILQYGTKHSLNVSVSIGIAAWEIQRRMRKQ